MTHKTEKWPVITSHQALFAVLPFPTLAKLKVDRITAYTLSKNSTGKLAFPCKLPSIFTNQHFCLLNIYLMII